MAGMCGCTISTTGQWANHIRVARSGRPQTISDDKVAAIVEATMHTNSARCHVLEHALDGSQSGRPPCSVCGGTTFSRSGQQLHREGVAASIRPNPCGCGMDRNQKERAGGSPACASAPVIKTLLPRAGPLTSMQITRLKTSPSIDPRRARAQNPRRPRKSSPRFEQSGTFCRVEVQRGRS